MPRTGYALLFDMTHRLYRVGFSELPVGWRVLAADGAPASALFADREEAVAFAKGLATAHGWARIEVYGRNALIERQFGYGRERREAPIAGRPSSPSVTR